MYLARSVSQPSVGTSGINTQSNQRIIVDGQPTIKQKGQFLWEGKFRKYTEAFVMMAWNPWFQRLVLTIVIYKFVMHFLIAYFFDDTHLLLDMSVHAFEIIFIMDVVIHILHAHWPLVRQHVRVYRRNSFFLAYDIFSLLYVVGIYQRKFGYETIVLVARWIDICRIYRLFHFFRDVNEQMRKSRMVLFFVEQIVTTSLIMHAGTCIWYSLNKAEKLEKPWYNIGYPPHVNSRSLTFNCYRTCIYYCACRFFNVIFGDAFPVDNLQKWLTSSLSLLGFVYFRYRFIGSLTWELVVKYSRRWNYIETYHYMVNYLNFSRAPLWLREQCVNYKLKLWQMKNGILRSDQLQKLPLPLQMELIFDINVGYFHSSILFRDTKESFMRQISLLVQHEFYLAGQQIWSQGVIKNGMIFIKRGVIEMLSDEDDESPIISFKKKTVLGELNLFCSIPSKVTLRAASYVELQVLRRTDFMRAIGEHPEMREVIRNKIYKRIKDARTRQEAIERYDKGDLRLIRTRYRPMKVLKDNLAGVEEDDSTFVDDSHMFYRDANNERKPKFTNEYLELYRLSTNVTTIEAPHICLRAKFPWILIPDTDFTRMFDVAHFVMVLYLCIMSPYSALHEGHTEADNIEKVFSYIVLTGLLVNIYLQLTTAIVDKNTRIETVKDIAEVKMATFGFYLDIISVFPVYIFTDTLDPLCETVAGQIAKLFPILQVWHIWAYINKWAQSFHSHTKVLNLSKYLLIFIILCYWSGCFLYLFACPRKLCKKNSWMAQLIFWETKVYMSNKAKHETPIKTAFSFGTAIFTGSGSTDIAPGESDIIIVAILFVIGAYLSCFYSAMICSNYLLSIQKKIKFKESMRELFYFLSINHVSGKIKARVKKFFLTQWYYNNSVSVEELFEDMSTNIRQEVQSLIMVETLISCPLFKVSNRDFLQTLANKTRKIILPDNEVVQHAADIGRDMYILKKGHCDVLNHSGEKEMTIGPGSYFGVIEMLFGLPKVYTVVTSTNCILLHVEFTALMQCWGTFPDVSHPILTVLRNPELRESAAAYEEAKPLSGKLDVKKNRLAQELKDSFVLLTSHKDWKHYKRTFEKFGIFRHLRYIFIPGCITPYGLFLKCWCSLRFVLAIYYTVSVPYVIATKQYRFGSRYNWIDIFLYIDIIVMSYLAHYNESNLLVTHPVLNVLWYFKHGFLWDLITVFPFEALVRVVNDSTDLNIYRINRMLCITRVTSAFSYLESDIMHVNPFIVLIKFLPIAAAIVNLAAALIFANACVPYLPSESSYVMVNCTSVMMLHNNGYKSTYAYKEYAYTFYWVYEVFLGLGCSPIGTWNTVDSSIVMCIQITGCLYFAFMFAYISSTSSSSANALLEHNEKIKDLGNFLYQTNVDPALKAKTLKYFEYVWKRTKGSNPQKICRRFNSALMEDTLVFMYERSLREVPLFGTVERSFIRVITQHLHEMYFLKGDTVVQCKDMLSCIFIIYRGKVDVLTSYNEMITCMGPGGMFGNFSGQPISCSNVAIYASRSLDLLVIPSATFFNLIKYYPKIQEPLNKAFEMSTDYILPITLDLSDDSSSDNDSRSDLISIESGHTDKSETSKTDLPANMMTARSQSNLSGGKFSASVTTYQSYTKFANLLQPGTFLFQVYGYFTCFMVTANYVLSLYDLVTLNDCIMFFWMYAIFDVYFYIKVFHNMHQGYLSRHGGLIIDRSKCRQRYFNHKLWLWSDVLANIPLEFIGFCLPNNTRAIHYLRANKLLRVKYLYQFHRMTSKELTNNLTILQAVMTVIAVIFMIHTFACLWLISMIGLVPFNYIRTLKIHLMTTDSPQHRWDYITSLYIVISQLTTTGGDEFVVDNTVSMIILGIVLICGKILAAIVVATSIQLAYATKYALTSYEKANTELIDMLKDQGLSSYQLKKFWKYIQQLWVTERGRQLPVLLSQTPYVRRCDLMSAMFGHYLRSCYIFADTGESFLRQITVVLDYTIFFPGNYIVIAGESEARMYWVASGTVSVVSVRTDFTEITHETLGSGDMFGILQGMHKAIAHSFSYKAETKVTVLSLTLDSWINILPFFPEAKRIIQERSEVLFTQI